MNRTYDLVRRAKYAAYFCISLALLAMPVYAAKARAERGNLFTQQQAWQEWASRFWLAAGFRGPRVRIAQKWNSEEVEKYSSPIVGLRWVRESTYVRDEPCRAVQLTAQGSVASSDAETETCAVILTTAVLKQDSNGKNTTPEDFKLHELRTAGTARGANRIITYISLKAGLLIRATEEASQQMSVTVAKADGSNRVHYDVNAKSRSEVVLVTLTPLKPPLNSNKSQ